MKRSHKKALIITGILLALPVLFLVEEHFRGKWALAKLKRELAAKGEKLTIDACLPPAVDTAENGYVELLRALGGFSSTKASEVAPGALRMFAPAKVWVVFDLKEWSPVSYSSSKKEKVVTNNWESLEQVLAPVSDQLPALRETLRRPVFHSTLNYHLGFEVPMPHLARLKGLAQQLAADSLLQLHRRQPDAAIEDIIALLHLGDALRDERFLISQLVRFAMMAIAVGPSWQTLHTPGVTEEQLARLQQAWGTNHLLADMTLTVEMERAVAIAQYARFRASPDAFVNAVDALNNFGGTGGGGTSFDDVLQSVGDKGGAVVARGIFAPLWQFAWSHEDERFYIATTQSSLDNARQSVRDYSMSAVQRGQESMERTFAEQNPYSRTKRVLANLLTPSLDSYLNRPAMTQAQRDLAVTAIALRRYELRHGRLPAELSALVPEFLPAAPRDIFDGQPLRYRLREEGGFLLYSIGKDARDDDGDARPPSGNRFAFYTGRDLVWPRPATPEEIAAEGKKTNGAVRAAPWPKN